jgi:hypothetical protein
MAEPHFRASWSIMVAIGLLLVLLPALALAEPVTEIANNGPASNRVNVVILGDGYKADQMPDYANDAEILAHTIFGDAPFGAYERYFNVYRVDVVSNDSGADHPEKTPAETRDTALNATYNCRGIERLLCVDQGLVNAVLSRSKFPFTFPDPDVIVLVIVNDVKYGGSGGAFAVTSTDPASADIALHELGHSFGDLADEYEDPGPEPCNNKDEPRRVNVTMKSTLGDIKWNRWIEPGRTLPSTDNDHGRPGAYEGAQYCSTGLFRPTFDSKMRVVSNPWEQINSEQLVKQIYAIVDLIDRADPPVSTLHHKQGDVRRFSVQTPQPAHPLTFAWRVDGGSLLSQSTYLDLKLNLSPGSHSVEVTVEDPTTFVRGDRPRLKQAHTWTVVVEARMPDLVVTAVTSPGTAAAGGVLAVTDTVQNAGDATAAASTTRHYLSADRTKDPGDVLLTPGQILGRLLPGQAATLASVVTVPPTTALGSYFLISCADDLNVVPESDENNNCQAIPVTIVLPRLAAVTAFTGSATGVGTGSSFVRINGRFTVPGNIDLRTSVTVLPSVLGTTGGVGDLVGGAPFSLARNVIRAAAVARFETAPGARPFARLEIRARGGNTFDFLIEVSNTIVAQPSHCPAELTTSFALSDATNPPLRVATGRVWQCVSSNVLRSP